MKETRTSRKNSKKDKKLLSKFKVKLKKQMKQEKNYRKIIDHSEMSCIKKSQMHFKERKMKKKLK